MTMSTTFKLANATLLAALSLAMTGCSDDDGFSDNNTTTPPPVEKPIPPVVEEFDEYVADRGYHAMPSAGIFSGVEGEKPNFTVPEGALTPVVTSDVAVRSASTRNVVQFTSVDNAGLVASFDLSAHEQDLIATASLEFDLRLVGATNGNTLPDQLVWSMHIEGQTAQGRSVARTKTLTQAVTSEWQHFTLSIEETFGKDERIVALNSIKLYPNAPAVVYNLDNIAIYPEYIDSEGPVLVLKGDATITQLNYPDITDVFTDPGYNVSDNIDEESQITVTTTYGENGEVNADLNGTYTITYSPVDSAGNFGKPATRTVIIESPEADTTAPVITLIGPATVRVALGGEYTEQGATALDNIDGDLSESVHIEGAVDVNTVGTYTITYSVSDKMGNEATAERSVVVYDPASVTDIVKNGDFSADYATDWVLQEGAGKVEIVNGELVISEYAPGASWQPRFVQAGIELTPEQAYIVQFDAKAGEARNIVLQVGELLSQDPWYLNIMDDTTVSLGTEMQTHQVEFTANDNAANPGHLIFAIGGGVATPITLDNVSIMPMTPEMVAPELTLVGGPVRVAVGEKYVEPGYSAIDNIDGDITANVIVEGADFSTAEVGTHTITYRVTDSHENETTATRKVSVVSAENLSELVSNGDFSADLDSWMLLGGTDAAVVDGAAHFTRGVLKQERFGEGLVSPAAEMVLSFKLKGSFTEGGVFKVGLHSESAPDSGLPASSVWTEFWTIEADWQSIEIPWTLGENADSISIEMLVAGPEGQAVYIDDVSIKPAP